MGTGISMGGFVPANEAHAIVSVSLQINFDAPLSNDDWASVRKSVLEIGREFGLGVPQPYFAVGVAFDSPNILFAINAPLPNVQQGSGLQFSVMDDSELITDRVAFTRDGIVLITNDYIRWGPLFEAVKAMLLMVWPGYTEKNRCISVRLEYVDQFVHQGEGIPDPFAVVNRDSPYLTRDLPEGDFWHSHTGRFRPISAAIRRTEIARVDYGIYADVQGQQNKAVMVLTAAQDVVGAQGYDQDDGNEFDFETVLATLEDHHRLLKEMLGRIITTQAGERISLGEP